MDDIDKISAAQSASGLRDNARPLAKKRVLLTGGTTGIGRATIPLLAGQGAHILTFGRDGDDLNAMLSELSVFRGNVQGMAADVTISDDIDRVFAAIDQLHGGIDILVVCAAVGAEPLHEMAEEEWRYIVETNLIGALACARRAIVRMQAQGGGHLLFVGSVSTEFKAVGESLYAATKAGLQTYAQTLRKEVAADNIRVSIIQPGSVATPMQQCDDAEKRKAIRNGEMLHAREIAEAILFALTRSAFADVVNLRIEPLMQKTE